MILGRQAFLLSLLTITVVGCGKPAHKYTVSESLPDYPRLKTRVTPPPRNAQTDLNPYAFDCYVNGTILEQAGDLPAASQFYKTALQYYPTSYEIRYCLAATHFKMRRFQDVLSILEPIKPEDLPVLDIRAACFHTLGMNDSARATYVKIVKLDQDDAEAYSYLAEAYRMLNNLDSAIWVYENLARLYPHSYRFPQELGRLKAQGGNLNDAKTWFRKSLEITSDPTNIISYVGLGEVFRMSGQSDSAVMILKEGLKVEPTNILINSTLTGVYLDYDSLQTAATYARKVVEAAPLERTAVRRLGAIYYGLDSLRLADSIFTYLVNSGERHPADHFYLGRIRLLQKEYAGAVQEFLTLTQLADSSADNWIDLGYAYRQNGDREKEITAYQAGMGRVKDEPGKLKLLFALAAAYEQAGRIPESVAGFEEIISKDPKNAQALNYLGYMLADRGERLEYARKLLEKAVEIAPENAAFQDSYGWVFYRLADYEKAIAHLRKAVSLDKDPVIFDHLGDALKAAGKSEEARTWWEKALELQPDNSAIKEKLGP